MDRGKVTFWDEVDFSPLVSLRDRQRELISQVLAEAADGRGVDFLAADLAAVAGRADLLSSVSNLAPGDQVYLAAELSDPDPSGIYYSDSLPDDFEDHLEWMDHGGTAVVVAVRKGVPAEVMLVTDKVRGHTPPRPL